MRPRPKNPDEQRSHNSGVNRSEQKKLFVEAADVHDAKARRGGA